MEDVSEVFKRYFNSLHKGTAVTQTVQDRKEIHNKARRARRDTISYRRRNIDENLSPYHTPLKKCVTETASENVTNTKVPEKSILGNTSVTKNSDGISKRLELLSKWKAEKEKRKHLEKSKAKPIFKVCHLSPKAKDLENANKLIKGKPIVPGSATKNSQFAPLNHKFNPPKGIKPLNFDTPRTQTQNFGFSIGASSKAKGTPQQKTRINYVARKPVAECSGTSKGTPQQKTRINYVVRKPVAECSSSSKSTPQQKTRINYVVRKPVAECSSSSKGTPQQKTRINYVVRKPVAECSSSSKGSSIQEQNRTAHASAKHNNKTTLKEVTKPLRGRFSRDEEDGLIEREVTKKPVVAGSSKGNSKTKTTHENKKVGSSNTSLLKKSTPLPRAQSEKAINLKMIQKSPKKSVGWNTKKSDLSSQSSNGTPVNKITFRKTPKKSGVVIKQDKEDLKVNELKMVQYTDIAHNINKESPEKTSTKNDSSNSDGLNANIETEQPLKVNAVGSSSSSTDYSVDYTNLNSSVKIATSPIEHKTPPPVYVSPFVTISRGKDSARKEYKIRASQGKEDLDIEGLEFSKILTAHTSPKAGAVYFKRKLDTEIDRIKKICKDWENYLKDAELPEDSHSSIECAIGQSRLLISKKFEQFRGLISQCETENYETKPVTCEDLHGFWDMVYMQVEDLDKRFSNLEKLRENNWQEILPEKVAPVKRSRGRPKKGQTKSKLKSMIQELKQKQKEKQLENNVENSLDCRTPVEDEVFEENNSSKKKSLRVSLLHRERKSRCSSSPGLMLMKISQSIKQGDGLTPARSILKTEVFKSTGKKSVVFRDDLEVSPKPLRKTNLFHYQDKENISENLMNSASPEAKLRKDQDNKKILEDLISFSPAPLTPRRSTRISKLKK